MTTPISVGRISAVVDVTVLPRNPLPLILGEDWFQAAQAELVVKPPKPTELHHPSTNTVLFCHEKVFPRMSNAVFLHSQPLLTSPHFTTGGLQLEPLPDNNQPPWLSLAYLCFLLLTAFLYIMNFHICLHPQGCPMLTCREIKKWERLNRGLTTVVSAECKDQWFTWTTPDDSTESQTEPISIETTALSTLTHSTEMKGKGNAIRAQQQRKRRYDESHRDAKFHVGQYVWLQRQEPITDSTAKLAPTFKGLYKIVDQRTPVTFVVRRATAHPASTSSRDKRIVHSSQIKPFRPLYFDQAIVNLQQTPLAAPPDFPASQNDAARLSPPPLTVPIQATCDEEPCPEDLPAVPDCIEDPVIAQDAHTSSRPRRPIRQPRWLDDYDV
ncbi:hypothetical protein HPB50_008522 [Hyalomma asiaticum]|uniref:Uncharacterized protein n=1 Tax=Hyalomma asiaticum TaxID=266040 RepID=A0ACB7RK90_HYAAI|nr:hypothetical protein HPB50_008522 [Hyalomma asiaticum]